ncbi:autotransporter domain-containing protein [Tianweitania sp. BSSL-BM11]|uniref:Autotransporter domain-containing protein n=1 Tax=Tianweitania aestuarii TaxID=2814886 RepID=A0ABS5RQM0_9HYPH|nr:autotransporter domain-containing protein [Tianweitania aestuarii]MBS9719306.1 autotransporter domain-containing protein [Tianweitania aestuarii]
MANTSARGRTHAALKATTAGMLLLAFGAGAQAQDATENSHSLKFMVFNIWNQNQNSKMWDPTAKANGEFVFNETMKALLSGVTPDVLVLPELNNNNRTPDGFTENVSDAITRNTLDVLNGLPRKPGFTSYEKNLDEGSKGSGRVFSSVPFENLPGDTVHMRPGNGFPDLVVTGIHLNYYDEPTYRLPEAKRLNQAAASVNVPSVIMGDFNAGDVSERGLHSADQQAYLFGRVVSDDGASQLWKDLAQEYIPAGREAEFNAYLDDMRTSVNGTYKYRTFIDSYFAANREEFPGKTSSGQLSWREWETIIAKDMAAKGLTFEDETYPVASNTPVTMNVLKKQYQLFQQERNRELYTPSEVGDGRATWTSDGEDATNTWPSWDRVNIDHIMMSRPFAKWAEISDTGPYTGTLAQEATLPGGGSLSDHEAVAQELRWIGPKLETYADGAAAKTRLVWGKGAYDFDGRNKEFFLTRNNMRTDVHLGQIADENGNPILAGLTVDEKKMLLDCASTDARFAKAIQEYCIDDHSFIGETLVTDGGTLIVDEDAALGGVDADLRLANGTLRINGTAMSSLDREVKLDASGAIDVVDAGADVSVRQAISGQGGLAKRGAGMLTLDAANSYTGGTLVEAGTLRAGVAGGLVDNTDYTVNGGRLDLNNHDLVAASLSGLGGSVGLGSASLLVDQSINTRFDGTIDGAGSLTKSGDGWLVLNGVNGYTGGTQVLNGGLIIGDADHAGASIVGNVALADGAILAGSGTMGGLTVASGATVAPGNSIGTLRVAGDVTLAAGSTYQVEIDPSGAGDRIAATGSAQIEGANVFVQKAQGTYTPGRRYEILTALGGIDGRFAALNQNLPFIDLGFTYDPTRVTLDVARNAVDFATVGETANQRATAGAVEALGGGNAVYDAVVWQADEEAARTAFDALSGEVHASTRTALINDSAMLRNAANERIRTAFASVGATDLPVMSYADGAKAIQSTGPAGPTLWTQGFGVWSTTKGTSETAELEQSTGGFFTGFDGALSETWRLGLMAGYSHSSFDVDGRSSSASSDNYHLGLYGGGQWDRTSLRAGVGYSWHSIETSRSVAFTGFSDGLSGDYDAGTFQAFGELAHRFDVGQAAIEPFANLAYVSLDTDGFTERGGAAALSVDGGSMDTTFTTLGVRASAPFNLGSVTAQARGLIGWQHAYGDTSPNTNVAFAGGGAFDVTGAAVADDTAVIEAGIDFTLSERATLGVQYGGQFGSDFTQNAVKAKFSLNF